MALETVRIKVESDASGVQSSIDKLVELGKVDQKNADQFKKNNAEAKSVDQERLNQIINLKNNILALEERIKKSFDPRFIEEARQAIGRYRGDITLLNDGLKTQTVLQAQVNSEAIKQLGIVENLKRRMDQLKAARDQANDPQKLIRYNELIESANTRYKALTSTIKAVPEQIDKNNTSIAGLATNLKNLAGTLGIVFGIQQIVSFGKEAIGLAAKAEGIRTAFEKLNKPDLLDQLRVATKGTVSDLALMTAAVKAENFHVPLEQLGTYFHFAQQRARETGESVDYLVESIVNGIGRKSVRIIDNLGISQVEVQKEFKRTGDFAQAVSNILEKELKKQGDVAETSADKFAKYGAEFENMKVTIGSFLTIGAVGLLDFLDGMVNGFNLGTDAVGKFKGSVDDLEKSPFLANITNKSEAELTEMINALQKTANEKIKAADNASAAFMETSRIEQLKSQRQLLIDAREAAEQKKKDAQKSFEELSKLTKQELEDMNTDEAKAELKRRKRIEDANKQLEELTKANQKAIIDEMQDGLNKQVAIEDEKNREILAKLEAVIPLSKAAEIEKTKSIENQQKAHKQNLLDIETKFIKDADAKQKEYYDNAQAEMAANLKEEETSWDKNVKDAEKREADRNKVALLATKKGSKERIDLEIQQLEDLKEESAMSTKGSADERFIIEAELQEKIDALKQKSLKKDHVEMRAALEASKNLINEYFNYQSQISQQQLADVATASQAKIDALNKEQAIAEHVVDKRTKIQKDFDARRKAVTDAQLVEERRIKTEQFQRDKDAAVIRSLINGAEAVTAAYTMAPPGAGFVLAGIIAAATLVEIGFIESQPTPKFAKGGQVKGRLHSQGGEIIEAERDEWVINRAMSMKYNEEMKAANEGNLEKLIYQKYVMPVISKQSLSDKQQSTFAENIAKSLLAQSNEFDDFNIVNELTKSRNQEAKNAFMIAKAITQSGQVNHRKF